MSGFGNGPQGGPSRNGFSSIVDYLKAFKDAHLKSDVDSGKASLHHTIGLSPNQAASGDHTHPAPDLTGYALVTHNHDGTYSFVGHTHPAPPAYVPPARRVGTKTTGTHMIGTNLTTHVNFTTAFDVGVTPRVFLQLSNVVSADSVDYEPINITNTGFDISSVRSAGTGAINVNYTAEVDQ